MGLFGKRTEDIAKQAAQEVLKSFSARQAQHVSWLRDTWQRDKIVAPYSQLPIVYAAINAKASRIARVPMKFYRPGSDTERESDPIISLMEKPAPNMNRALFLQALVVNKETTGEWFVQKDSDLRRGVPSSLRVHHRNQYKPKFISGQFSGWEIRPDGRGAEVVTDDDVIFDRYYHPHDPLRGLSPLEAAWLALDTEYQARRYNRNFFYNDASPGKTYATDATIDDVSYERLKNDLLDSRQGADNAHRGLILDNGLKPVTEGISQRDAQFIEQMGLTLHDVCAVYNVDPAIIGFEKESKYASAKEARRYFWTDTIIPYLRGIEEKLNNGLLLNYNVELRFDTTNIEALAYTMTERVEAAQKLWQMGFTANEINDRLDLGFDDRPERDEPAPIGQPVQMQASGEQKEYVIGGSEEPDHEPSLPEMNKAYRAKRWKEVTDKVRPIMGKLRGRLRTYFRDVERKVNRELMKGAQGKAAKDIAEDVDPVAVAAVVNANKLNEIVTDFITDGARLGYETVIEPSFDVLPQKVLQYVKGRGEMIREVAENARRDIQGAVEDAIREAVENGYSEAETANVLQEKLKGKLANIDKRTRTIARTEVHSAFSAGRKDAMDETEPDRKIWISARDGNVRDDHQAKDGQIVGWEDKFSGGLSRPLDPDAPADEVINCRCIMEAIYDDE
jgi:HK97 family phage portal protein